MLKVRRTAQSPLIALAISLVSATQSHAQVQGGPAPNHLFAISAPNLTLIRPQFPAESRSPRAPVVQTAPRPVVSTPAPPAPTQPLELPKVTIFNPSLPTDVTRSGRPLLTGEPSGARSGSSENFHFAMTSCQGMSNADNEFVVFPERGSLFRIVSPAEVELARGRMVVISDTAAVKVQTAQARILVPEGSAAIVEASPQTGATVFSLAGKRSLSISLKNSSVEEEDIELPSGQTISIADTDLSAEELIGIDGVERRPIEGRIRAVGTARFFEFSPAQLAGKNMLVACHALQLDPSSKIARLVGAVEDRVLEDARSQGRTPLETTGNKIARLVNAKPEASTPLATSFAASAAYCKPMSDDNRLVAATNNSVYHASHNDTIVLELGTVVLRSCSPIKVQAGASEVRISHNGVALVEFDGAALKVINLCDLRGESVVITHGNQALSVDTGREVILTAKAPALPHLYNVHDIGHRQVSSKNLGKDGWITASEIDLTDILAKHPLVSLLRRQASSSEPERRLVSQVTKAAAIMTILHGTKEPFQRGVPEDEQGAIAVVAGKCVSCQP